MSGVLGRTIFPTVFLGEETVQIFFHQPERYSVLVLSSSLDGVEAVSIMAAMDARPYS